MLRPMPSFLILQLNLQDQASNPIALPQEAFLLGQGFPCMAPYWVRALSFSGSKDLARVNGESVKMLSLGLCGVVSPHFPFKYQVALHMAHKCIQAKRILFSSLIDKCQEYKYHQKSSWPLKSYNQYY